VPKEFDMNKYAQLFISESRELLRSINSLAIELEKDPEKKETVDQMFRDCHTIKGMAGMMNVVAATELSHALEDVLGSVRDGKLKANSAIIDGVLKALDAIEVMVGSFEKNEPAKENPELVEMLKSLLTAAPPSPLQPPSKEKTKAKGRQRKAETTAIKIKLGRRCSLPSARAVVILKELSRGAEILETNPTEDEIEREQFFETLTVVVEPGPKFNEASERVFSMIDVEEMTTGLTSEPIEKWHRQVKQAPTTATMETAHAQTVKVSMDRLDNLLDDVGELVIGRSRLVEKASVAEDFELQEISSLIDKLTADIQSKVLTIRLIPLDVVMNRFPRMVRDLSKSQDKEVELVVEGGGIELDRTVVDKVTEPMMHLLRNCIDHGIETGEERIRLGKHQKGLIRIVASRQQDHVLIEVSDDGRGIDYDRIRNTAVERGVMTAQQAESATGKELIGLLFKPGFSTKTEVTQVSGRGVGLDVVKKSVEDLGGNIVVTSSKGAGTTFSLWLPFTLAIIEAMLVGIADQTYAVPMSAIVESHKFETEEVKFIRAREVVQLRGEVLPLIRMRNFYGVGDQKELGPINALVVQSRDKRAALVVDDLIGHQQIVVKSLDKRLNRVKGISGGTILGSGRIALIVDVDTILGG